MVGMRVGEAVAEPWPGGAAMGGGWEVTLGTWLRFGAWYFNTAGSTSGTPYITENREQDTHTELKRLEIKEIQLILLIYSQWYAPCLN